MKKKLFIISLIAIFFVCIFSFSFTSVSAAEKTEEEKVNEELENIYLPSTAIIDFPVPYVSAYGSTIKWESSNSELLNVPENGGWVSVTRPEVDTLVTLTVTITNGNASGEKSFEITVLKGVTHTNTYNITYVLNSGTNNPNNPSTYKVGTTVELLDPTKGRVEFLGWYDNAEFVGEKITSLPKGLSGDYTLYAKWAEAKVESIRVESNPTKTTYNALETFDPTGIKVVAVYNDDLTTEEVSLEDLEFVLQEADSEQPLRLHGRHTEVTVKYGEHEASVELTVNKLNYDLSDYFQDTTVTYNGGFQTISEYTSLPEGLVVSVQGGGTNASDTKYPVKVVVTEYDEDDYNEPTNITVYLTINKANLTVKVNPTAANVGADMPTFSVSYDGFKGNDTEASLGGKLEFVCEVTDTQTVGTYTVSAKGLTSENYEITYEEGAFVIIDGKYEIYVDPSELTKTYNGEEHMFTAVVKNGEDVLEEITNITYEINNVTFKGATNAGIYYVTVSYHHEVYGDGTTIVEFNINKAKFDVKSVSFTDLEVEYDGKAHTIEIEGTLPEGVTVSYSEGITDAGSTTIVATFTGNSNYEEITDTLEATLTVTAKELSVNMFESIPSESYTGSAVEPVVKGTFANTALEQGIDFTVEYKNNVEQGTAQVVVTGTKNFQGTVTLTFEIGESDLVKAQDAKEELETKYNTDELPIEFVTTTTNNAKVTWFSTSTALGINNETGEITMIQTNEEQVVLVYSLIIVGDSAEYASFEFTVPALEQDVEDEEFPLENVDYNLVVEQGNTSKTLYATGELSGYYGATTEDIAYAAIINVIKVEGGYHMIVKSTGKYINIVQSGTYINIKFEDSATSVWVYNSEYNTMTTLVGEETYYIGAYNTYNTLSPSKISFASTSFTSYLALAKEATEEEKLQAAKEALTLPAQTTSNLTLPETGEFETQITWATSNSNAITSEGVVTQGTEDVTVILTATLTLGQSVTTKEFEVTVPKLVVVDPDQTTEEVTGTITFDDTAKRTELSTEQQIWVENNITVTNNKGSSTSNVADYAKPVRFYKTSELVISVNGYIKSIVVNCNTASYATALGSSVTGATVSDKTVTITLDGTASSVTYTLSGGQVRVDSITVTYVTGSSSDTPVEPEVPTHEHTACPTCGLCTATDCDGDESVKCQGHTTEPEVPTHEHTACLTCGLCTATDCDGEESVKCQGHTTEPVEPGQTVEATITFDADKTQRTEFSSEVQVWKNEGLTFTNDKASSSNAVGDYSNPVRLYAGSTLAIEASGMTKIVIVSDGTAKYKTALENALTAAGLTFVADGSTYTIALASETDKVELTLTAQARFKSITVTHTSN